MFQFRPFEEAFGRGSSNAVSASPQPLRRAKTLGQRMSFIAWNFLLLPIVALIYLSVGSEGLRMTMPVLQTRLYKMPIPGANLLRTVDSLDKIDLSMVVALMLFVAVTALWIRIFRSLQDAGALAERHASNPVLSYLLAGISAIILLADAGIFYVGLSSQASSSWSETPWYVAPAATALFVAGTALIGAWHADHSQSSQV